MRPEQTRFEPRWWKFLLFFFLTFCYAMHYSFLLVLRFREIGQNWRTKCKISRLSLLVSRPWSGPLRHVCGHTNHHTTMFHTFLESLSDLDVHPGKRFALLGHYRQNWRREIGTQNNKICSLWPIYLLHSYVFYIFACLYMLLARGG